MKSTQLPMRLLLSANIHVVMAVNAIHAGNKKYDPITWIDSAIDRLLDAKDAISKDAIKTEAKEPA